MSTASRLVSYCILFTSVDSCWFRHSYPPYPTPDPPDVQIIYGTLPPDLGWLNATKDAGGLGDSGSTPYPVADREPCSPPYSDHYCLHGGTCYTMKLDDHIIIGCMCKPHYYGKRCDYYGPDYASVSRQLNAQGISLVAAGILLCFALVAILILVIVHIRHKRRTARRMQQLTRQSFEQPFLQPTEQRTTSQMHNYRIR